MRFNKKNIESTSFKKRNEKKHKKNKLVFGDFSFTLSKSYTLEYIYLYNFKKSLKKYYSFKKSIFKKVWLFLHKNYPLTKKSKNSRMGKGKGAFSRFCSKIYQNHNLLEFSGFSIKELIFLKKIFLFKVPIKLNINCSFFLKLNKQVNVSSEYFFFKKFYRR